MRAERGGEPSQRDLAALERRLTRMRACGVDDLTCILQAGLDPSQVAAVGARLKAEREALERKVAELRLKERADAAPPADPFDLLSESEAVQR